MGNATREAVAALRDALAKQGAAVDATAAEDVLAVARLLGSSAPLRSAVADAAADPAEKSVVVRRAFSGKIAPAALELTVVAAQQRWSAPDDVVEGLEETGVRAFAQSAPAGTSITDELFVFESAVISTAELELALRSRLAAPEAKAALAEKLLGSASPQTRAIVRQLVLDSRDRGIRESLRWASETVADQKGLRLAVVTSAAPLAPAQLDRLRTALAARYGRDVAFNHIIDPSLIGGLRVQIGDDVIDSSIASRLNDVRLQLA